MARLCRNYLPQQLTALGKQCLVHFLRSFFYGHPVYDDALNSVELGNP